MKYIILISLFLISCTPSTRDIALFIEKKDKFNNYCNTIGKELHATNIRFSTGLDWNQPFVCSMYSKYGSLLNFDENDMNVISYFLGQR